MILFSVKRTVSRADAFLSLFYFFFLNRKSNTSIRFHTSWEISSSRESFEVKTSRKFVKHDEIITVTKHNKEMAGVLLEARPYRPFKSSEEYLYAMKEDLAEWLNMLYSDLELNADNFMDKLETGVVLCKHANSVKKSAEEYVARKHLRRMTSSQTLTASLMTKTALPITKMGEIIYRESAKPGTFFARDNVSNFIDFCRHGLEILECLLFETDDLIMRKNEKNVILCLLEVARRGAKFGMLAPILVQMEREIDREIAAEQRLNSGEVDDESSEDEAELLPYGPIPQIVTNDLKSLDEMVRDLVEKCTCPTQFPMIRVSEGKYRIGDTKILIFVRILRSHVMVRVGGGWDTLSHYLDKHDPCRCRTGHRAALSSKLILKNTGAIELNNAQVHYERSPPRTRRSSTSSSSSGHGGRDTRDFLSSYSNYPNRSRSPTPKRDNAKGSLQPPKYISTFLFDNGSNPNSESAKRGRSVSPVSASRRSFDAPTMASRNRSRSPSVRSPERQKKNSEIIANVKQNDVKYLTAGELNDFEAEQTRRAKVSLEANELSNDDSKQNDSGSEVSDEGYRSLGLIVSSPLVGEGKLVSSAGKGTKSGHSAHSLAESSDLRESPNSECYGSNDEENQTVSIENTKKKDERKSLSRERSMELSRNMLKTPSPSKNSSRVNSRSSSPARLHQSQTPTRRHSQMNESNSYRRSANKENEARKAPRSRSATSGRSGSDTLQSSKPMRNGSEIDKYGTWNGKSKKRPGIPQDTSSTFVRNGVGRCSLGARTTSYDPVTGRRVQKQKEQKNISPLLADLLKTKNLDDDKTILLKMKEIINQYSGIFEAPEKDFDADSEDLDFTSEWVKNNGSLKRLENGDSEEKSSPSKRKDSKYEGPHSKIPAPVFFKQQISEKECRI